jgi:hypothetical protein
MTLPRWGSRVRIPSSAPHLPGITLGIRSYGAPAVLPHRSTRVDAVDGPFALPWPPRCPRSAGLLVTGGPIFRLYTEQRFHHRRGDASRPDDGGHEDVSFVCGDDQG